MINISFFELFKIGPGPSSSHTVGPMRAAGFFRADVLGFLESRGGGEVAWRLRVTLYGALAATGRGHGTHRAVLAGLYGEEPAEVDIGRLNAFFESSGERHQLPFGKTTIGFSESDIVFNYLPCECKHPNTIKFDLLLGEGEVLSATFYSIGGGFVVRDGEPAPPESAGAGLPYPYSHFCDLVDLAVANGRALDELLLENEMAMNGMPELEIWQNIGAVVGVMRTAVANGLRGSGKLPGGLGVFRRAAEMYQRAADLEHSGRVGDAFFARLNAYALAVSEENAAGRMVVTAPTNGAAGILPAAVEYLLADCGMALDRVMRGMLVAGAVGAVVKHNASISGAELGCQAEVGTASAMAAALFTFCMGGNAYYIASAAEIALEHHLGMTCDPVMGLVQIPCIERNANGVIKAYNAYLLASGRGGESKPVVSFDQVVEVMRQTGVDLSEKYKETARGGLAVSFGWGNMPGS